MSATALDALRAGDAAMAAGHYDRGFLSERWGLLPPEPPLTDLPESHRAWDVAAASLPHLYRTQAIRQNLDRLPPLDADEDALPQRYVWRACSLLGMFAHAYIHARPDRPAPLPDAIERPWRVLNARLHRPEVALTYDDLIAYNWRLRDPSRPEERTLANLDLLTPTVGNREERIFYLTQTQVLAAGAPMIPAMARAQTAVHAGDALALERELVILLDTLERVTRTFLQIDPNPYSDTYVDPVVWAKTVAPFAGPIREGVHAVSGAAAPLFHLLDVFIGRRRYDSRVGRESHAVRSGYGHHMRELLTALESTSVADAVVKDGSQSIRGLWRALLDAYSGREGFLGVHRRKAFAYLELAFKVGHAATGGGFTGLFDEQSWELAHAELEVARKERLDVPAPGCPMARPHAEPRGKLTAPGISHVVLDVEGAGLRHQPGDRLALLPRSNRDLIAKTLAALRATGKENVRLDAKWSEALRNVADSDRRTVVPLAELLARGTLRPVSRDIARALLAISGSEALGRIVNARAEGRWELWDLIELVTASGFDPHVLWQAEPWEPYSICKLVPPQDPRLYSVSSMHAGDEPCASSAELLVAELQYRTEESVVSRAETRSGTGSSFIRELVESRGEGEEIPVRVVRAPRFRLPDDPTAPIILFAGGGGIAPFRAFIAARASLPQPPETSLFLSTRNEAHVALHQEEFASYIAAGWLHFIPTVTAGPGAREGRVGIREEIEARAEELLATIRDRNGYVYSCGAAGFASAAATALESALAKALSSAQAARLMIRRLIGTGRYQQDVFTSHRAETAAPALLNASEVAIHNDDEHGYWMIIDGSVYDITEFAHRHPGGYAIMIEHAGRDGTRSYRTIEHHLDPEIEAMLGMYRIGDIRRLDFGSEWCVAIGPRGLTFVSLHDVFRAWVRMLHRIVEVENAVRHDFAIVDLVTVGGDDPRTMTHLKARLLLEAHHRFLTVYVPSLLGRALDELWSATIGLSAPDEDARELRREIDAIPNATASEALTEAWRAFERDELEKMHPLRAKLETANGAFLSAYKRAIARGVAAFERHERHTAARAGLDLLNALETLPSLAKALYSTLGSGATDSLR